MTSIQKSLVQQGNLSVQVYQDEGITFRSKDLEDFYPIVFRDIQAGQVNRYDLSPQITRDYQILGIEVDVLVDNLDPEKNVLDHTAEFNALLSLTILTNGVRVSQNFWNLNAGKRTEARAFLRPGQSVELHSSVDLVRVTFWCQTCFVEPEIILVKASV